MGVGLMGAGAAVKGLIGGYQQGRKFAQDEERFDMEKEDFQQRKEMRGLQMEGTKLSNKKSEGELADADLDREVDAESRRIQQQYEDRIRKTLENKPYQVPQQAAGITSPAPQGMPDATAFGIAEPGAPQSTEAGATQQAQPESVFQVRQQMMVDLLSNDLRRKGANRAEILKNVMAAGRFAKTAEAQAYADAMRDFKAGRPQQEIFSDLSRQFGKDVPPGTQMVMGEAPFYPGSKLNLPDVQIKLPNGQVISEADMTGAMLTAEQTLNRKTEIGKLHAQVSHHADMKELAAQEAQRRETSDANRHQEVMARFRESAEQNSRVFGLQFDKFQWDKYESRQKAALDELSRLYGFQPLTESDRIRIEKEGGDVTKAEARAATGSASVSAGMIVFNMNVDPRTLRPNAAPTEVMKAIETVGKVRRKELPPETIEQDDLGRSYVSVGGNKVFVPVGDLLPAKGRAQAAGEADPKRPGVKPPPVDAPPLPARYSGLQERGAEETKRRSEAEARKAAEKKAKDDAKSASSAEVKAFTPDRIRAMKPSEAAQVLREYGDVLSREQRSMLNKRL